MKWKALPWLMAAGFALRVVFALLADNIHHPDELFQYPEQAHRWVFGNGLVPWEFRFGTRSWLLPALVALPLQVSAWLHLDRPALYVPAIKILFCAISICVIPLVYSVARRLANESAGRIAAITAATWYELIYFSFRTLPDTLSAYLLLGAVALLLGAESRRRAAAFGAVLALAIALRSQMLPVAGVLALAAGIRWSTPSRVTGAAAGAVVVLAAGLVDRLTWGSWFASYYNNYLFNAVYGVSALFGENGYRFYADQLVIASFGVFALTGIWSLRWWRRLWLPIIAIGTIVTAHTLIGHKEYRFVFAAVPIAIVLFGVVIALATEQLGAARQRVIRFGAVASVSVISIAGAWNALPGERSIYSPVPLFAPDPSVAAYLRLADDPTVKAIFVADTEWGLSLGYFYLHRDVPIYFLYDVAAMRAESGMSIEAYASHSLHRILAYDTPGFELDARLGPLEIRRNVSGIPLRTLPSSSRLMPQRGIDGVFTPRVRPFLTLPK